MLRRLLNLFTRREGYLAEVRAELKQLRFELSRSRSSPKDRAVIRAKATSRLTELGAKKEQNRQGFRQWLVTQGMEAPEDVVPHVVRGTNDRSLRLAALAVAMIELPLAALVAIRTFNFPVWFAGVVGLVFTIGATGVLRIYWNATTKRLTDD